MWQILLDIYYYVLIINNTIHHYVPNSSLFFINYTILCANDAPITFY